ncbi:MAG: heme ABC transporter permease [Bdellovibrionales bacterium]
MPLFLFANPGKFLRLAERLMPWFGIAAFLCFAAGIYLALFASPADYRQGETVRIMYIHVPAAWIGLMLYVAMAAAAGVGLVLRHALADIFCVAAAPVGAVFTALCLVTGGLWGKPTWGAYWVWDARLTSVLILFLLYCGYIALRRSFDNHEKGGKAGAALLLAGVVNIPVIHFSVEWWSTLHQPASVFRGTGPSIDAAMLRPLFAMAFAYFFYTGYLVLLRMRTELAARRKEAASLSGRHF